MAENQEGGQYCTIHLQEIIVCNEAHLNLESGDTYCAVLYIHTRNSLWSDFHYFLYIFTSICIHILPSCTIWSVNLQPNENVIIKRTSTLHVFGWQELQPITLCLSVIGCGHLQSTREENVHSVLAVCLTIPSKW